MGLEKYDKKSLRLKELARLRQGYLRTIANVADQIGQLDKETMQLKKDAISAKIAEVDKEALELA